MSNSACPVIDRDNKNRITSALAGGNRSPHAFESGQWIDDITAIFLSERWFAAGVIRSALGNHRGVAGNELHADAAIAILTQIVKRTVPRGFSRTLRNEAPAGLGYRAKMGDEVRQALGPNFDFIAVGGGGITQLQADLRRRQAGPIGGVVGDQLIGMGGTGCHARQRQQGGKGGVPHMPPARGAPCSQLAGLHDGR